jgi:hypothetical protein
LPKLPPLKAANSSIRLIGVKPTSFNGQPPNALSLGQYPGAFRLHPASFGRPASIVGYGRHIFDLSDIETGGLE